MTAAEARTRGDFFLHRRRAWLALTMCVFVGSLFALFSLAMPPGWRIVCLGVAAIFAWCVLWTLRELNSKHALVRINAEGLYYRAFADRTVPWSEITRIARTESYSRYVVLGRVNWTRSPGGDQINFAVADWSPYPSHPGRLLTRAMQSMAGIPPIVIYVGRLNAAADAVVAEIKKYWRGDVSMVDARAPPLNSSSA